MHLAAPFIHLGLESATDKRRNYWYTGLEREVRLKKSGGNPEVQLPHKDGGGKAKLGGGVEVLGADKAAQVLALLLTGSLVEDCAKGSALKLTEDRTSGTSAVKLKTAWLKLALGVAQPFKEAAEGRLQMYSIQYLDFTLRPLVMHTDSYTRESGPKSETIPRLQLLKYYSRFRLSHPLRLSSVSQWHLGQEELILKPDIAVPRQKPVSSWFSDHGRGLRSLAGGNAGTVIGTTCETTTEIDEGEPPTGVRPAEW
ncbi:hypothetical protein BU16DRAFT_535513 [Lophium mytilinum]|uniref:Uncharacterized protein n=1 Tax=Lophium mytilinum TaxID=390894 RepID=A0A6A6R3P2_9PEZI|nr:hypothetical protein BU16DRAFT_535513 [Lophium mytilinum]